MPLGLGTALWAVVLPVEKVNLCGNPSAELGTTYWGTSTNGAIGTSSAFQQFGAWSFSCTPTAATTDGIRGGSVPLINGDYAVSAYIRGVAGVVYNLEIAPAPTGNALGSGTFTGGGTWQYVTFGYTEAGGGGGTITRAVVVRKRNDTSVAPFYVDGVQVEAGSVTTYFDGDTGGGTWQGAPHVSTSFRSGQYRGGGSVVALADLGLQVDQMPGVGMPPIENSAQSYAIIDGAQFQRQRATQRSFTLTAKPIVGTALADLHVTRRTLIDAFKPDLVTPQQPVRLLYVGGQGTSQIDAYYNSGLELGNMDGPIAEVAAIGFVSYDPYWCSPTQEGTTLAPRVALGSVNYIARRSPLGAWGSLGPGGTSVNGAVYGLLENNGTVFVGGELGSAGGTATRGAALYFPASNTFGTFGGTFGGTVYTFLAAPWGSIIIGGSYTGAGGTAGARMLSQWNGNFGTLIGGTVQGGPVRTLAMNPYGSLFIGGDFTQIAGTNNRYAAMWFNNAFGSLPSGSVSDIVLDFAIDWTNRVYIGGLFGSANGTPAFGMAQWANGSYGTVGAGLSAGGVTTSGTIVYAASLALGPDQRLYVGGHYGSAGGGSAQHISVWNGVQYAPLGLGLGTTGNNSSSIYALLAGSAGDLYAGGIVLGTNAGPLPFPDAAFHWNGASWTPLDINLNGIGYIYAWARSSNGVIYAAGSFAGTAQAASIGTIINTGRSQAYPILRLRNLAASGTIRVYQLLNTTTNNNIYFNLVLQAGERAVLDLTPGARSFVSNFQGNLFGAILPGSNLPTWGLLPGTNYVSFFSDSDSLEASFFWQRRGWSIDSGTV